MARIVPDAGAKVAPRPDAAASPLARPPAGRLGCYALALVCLAQFGAIGGWAYVHFLHPTWLGDHETAAAPEPKHEDRPDPLQPAEAPPTIERGDEMLKEGRYDLALKVYDPLAATAAGALRSAIAYRVGLCQEGLGRADQALKAYQQAVSGTESPRVRAAAELGQARVFLRRHRAADAKNLLYPLLLRSGTPELRDQPYVADVRYLLALSLTLEVLRPQRPSPLSDVPADYSAADWPVEAALEWVSPPKEAKPGDAEKPGEEAKEVKEANYVAVERSESAPGTMRVSAAVSDGTLAHLVERLAERAGLKVEWTDAARKLADGRNATLTLQDLPVGDVLIDLLLPLTDPPGLVATIKDDKLRLATETETPVEALTAYRTTIAQRALDSAVKSNPTHRLAPAAYLELGNLEARAGRLKEAAGYYERLTHEYRRSSLAVEGSYNLGLVRVKQGQTMEARTAFYAARDHAPGHELAPLAFLQIGRTHLLDGDPEQAVKPLNDALAMAAGTPTEPATALTLAAAYLLTDKPQQATRTVREHREPVGQPPYRATAVFLDAYGQFLTVKGKGSAREASELLAALWGVEAKEPVLGGVGQLLIGHAYRDLDQPDDMIAVYIKALPVSKGAVAAEMAYEVAQDLYYHGKYQAARKLYLPLAKAEGGKWAAAAQLRLAEIALREKRPEEALDVCRKLLEQKQPVKRETVLLLMSHAYEALGEYRKAAQCLEGKVPE